MNYSKFFSVVLTSLFFVALFVIMLVILDAASAPSTRVRTCYKGFQYLEDSKGALWIVSHKGQALTCNQ